MRPRPAEEKDNHLTKRLHLVDLIHIHIARGAHSLLSGIDISDEIAQFVLFVHSGRNKKERSVFKSVTESVGEFFLYLKASRACSCQGKRSISDRNPSRSHVPAGSTLSGSSCARSSSQINTSTGRFACIPQEKSPSKSEKRSQHASLSSHQFLYLTRWGWVSPPCAFFHSSYSLYEPS